MNPTIMTMARYLAKREVKLELKRQGRRLHEIEEATWRLMAEEMLRLHPELIDRAKEFVETIPDFVGCADLRGFAQFRNHCDRATSIVHMSCT